MPLKRPHLCFVIKLAETRVLGRKIWPIGVSPRNETSRITAPVFANVKAEVKIEPVVHNAPCFRYGAGLCIMGHRKGAPAAILRRISGWISAEGGLVCRICKQKSRAVMLSSNRLMPHYRARFGEICDHIKTAGSRCAVNEIGRSKAGQSRQNRAGS